ncbi:MAG: VOC family protein [Anaerolineales bacterium]
MPNSHVIPVLSYPDVGDAVDWLCKAFSFTLRWKVGNHRAQLNAGDGCIAVTQGSKGDMDRDFSIMVRVEDADAHHGQAAAMGARVLQAPGDYPYGERQYTVEDIGGYSWTFSTSIADVAPQDWGAEIGQL